MLYGPFLSKNWVGAAENFDAAKIVMLGLPFDGTTSNRPGTRFAPQQIRLESHGMETYSPVFDKDIEDLSFFDAGDLEFPFGNPSKMLSIIEKNVEQVLGYNKKFLGVGGEHLVTLGAIRAYAKKYKDLAVVHFDAHTDLRAEYYGETLTHAGVIYQVGKIIGFENILQFGIRSGLKEEFELAKQNGMSASSVKDLEKFKGRKIFLTLDLDVLDPSIMSGTGTPEAGGWTYRELSDSLFELKDYEVIGADVVELSPDYDTSKVSTATACKAIRDILCIL